ncbi:hypothetical protein KGM_210410A, partial [Danaus plexippus plexippus]
MSMLPLWSVESELAQYCLDRGAICVASEDALGCLVELDRPWDLALSVHRKMIRLLILLAVLQCTISQQYQQKVAPGVPPQNYQ